MNIRNPMGFLNFFSIKKKKMHLKLFYFHVTSFLIQNWFRACNKRVKIQKTFIFPELCEWKQGFRNHGFLK